MPPTPSFHSQRLVLQPTGWELFGSANLTRRQEVKARPPTSNHKSINFDDLTWRHDRQILRYRVRSRQGTSD
ncbi:MAG: hypothetical protein ACI8Z1_001541 [Candidatus Azotimanducaceae bacterium]|jgi:hypothetical protein